MNKSVELSAKQRERFSELFWAAREELADSETSADAHAKALAFAREAKWDWAETLLEASRLDRLQKPDKALAVLDACASPLEYKAYVAFVRGAALAGKGEFDEAIRAYEEARDDEYFDMPANAWYNIGTALYYKGAYDEAIKACEKAAEDPKFGSHGMAWNAIGVALGKKGDHETAITAFRKAIDNSKYTTPAYAWNNLGLSLSAQGKYEEAIKALRKALSNPKFEDLANVWTNLAQTYVLLGETELAREAFNKALATPDGRKTSHARARLGLQLLEAELDLTALSADDRALVEKGTTESRPDDIEAGIIAAIQAAGESQYEKYVARPDSNRDDILSVLRGWSSAVTLLEGSERRWRGGGYFLKWKGRGVVIDPGFDFLRNFHDAGYHGREIRAVIVSHNHPDHNSDLKDLDDLRYELFKRLARKNEPGSEPYILLWDQDTDKATKFSFEAPKHLYEPVVLASGFPQAIDLEKHPAKLPLRILPFKVNHGTDVLHAMGVVLELLDVSHKVALRIGYTADTAYFDGLEAHLANCDILIAHISQPSIDELQDVSKLKENHLGYRGTARLIKACKPKLTLVGEFWAGFSDLRIALVKGLRQLSGVESILPAGLSMHVRLPSLEIECTECFKPTSFTEIRVAPPTANFGDLAYLCPRCLLQ